MIFDIDADAYYTSRKALIVPFIILIFLLNCLLIFTIIRKGAFLYNSRSLTIISLAIGDIILALFPLIVLAKMFYFDYADMTCQTLRVSFVYYGFLIHFVYAVGLIVLAIELAYRYKKQLKIAKTRINIVKSVCCSAVPWFLGLIIVLPVTMADTDDYIYITLDICLRYPAKRLKMMYGVSVIMPLCLALIVCFIVRHLRLLPVQYLGQVIGYQNAPQGVVIATYNQQYPMSGTTGTQQVLTAPPNYNYGVNQDSKVALQEVNPLIAQYPPQQQFPVENYPPVAHAAQQYPPLQYNPQQQMSQPNVVLSVPANSTQPQPIDFSVFQNLQSEKNALVAVATSLFSCVIPLVGYTMGSVGSTYGVTEVDLILQSIFFWFSLLRSLLTPLIWMFYSRNLVQQT